jgi:phage terminase Nu1 subunit (DNA packaging protein)
LLEFYAEKKCKPLEKEILNLKAQILIEYDEGDSGGADSFKAQRMRLTRAQAEGQELKNDQVRGELINVNSAIQIFGKIIGEAITRLDSARSKIPTRVPGLKVTQYDAIDRVYSEARNNLADSDPQQIIDEALPNIT